MNALLLLTLALQAPTPSPAPASPEPAAAEPAAPEPAAPEPAAPEPEPAAAEAAPELTPAPSYAPIEDLPARPGAAVTTTTTEPAKPPQAGARLLVMDLVDRGAGADVTASISSAVAAQALKSHTGSVVSTEQIRVTLDASAVAALVGCESEDCMADVAKKVEADLVLSGGVTKVGDDVVINLILVNARDASRVSELSRKVPGLKDLYYYAAQALTSLALTGAATDARVPVRVVASEEGAQIIIDGQAVGAAPFTASLDPGAHDVRVDLDGFAPWRSQIRVEEATPMEIEASLVVEGVDLWPAAIAISGVGVATGIGAALFGLAAQDAFSGSVGLFGAPERSYLGTAPASSSELASKKQEVQRLALVADGLWVITGLSAVAATVLFVGDALGE